MGRVGRAVGLPVGSARVGRWAEKSSGRRATAPQMLRGGPCYPPSQHVAMQLPPPTLPAAVAPPMLPVPCRALLEQSPPEQQ